MLWIERGRKSYDMVQPRNRKRFTVPRHKTEDVPKGALKSILRDAGLE